MRCQDWPINTTETKVRICGGSHQSSSNAFQQVDTNEKLLEESNTGFNNDGQKIIGPFVHLMVIKYL